MRVLVKGSAWRACLLLLTVSCSTSPDIDPDLVIRVEVAPAADTLFLGVSTLVQLNATPRNGLGAAITGRTAAWRTSEAGVATVNSGGVVTAVGLGTATITATIDGIEGSATIVVEAPPVATVTVALGADFLAVGGAMAAGAVVRDAAGNELPDRVVAFSTSNAAVATITDQGIVTGVGQGTVSIRATSESTTGAALLCVLGQDQNLRVEQVILTQAIQRPDGSVPLIAGGNPADVRVFATASTSWPAGCPFPHVQVVAYDGDSEVARVETDATGPLPAAAGAASPSARAVLEGQYITPGLRLRVEIDPLNAIPELDDADNAWPAAGAPAPILVAQVPTLEFRFVPVLLANFGSAGEVTVGTMDEYLYATRQMYPVSTIDWEIADMFSTTANFGTGGQAAWVQILQELDAKRVIEASKRYYVGALRPPNGVSSTQFGGFGYVPFNPASTGPGTRTSVLVGVGWFNRQRQTTELVAHEVGHNHGRQHGPCGGAANPDPAYPHNGAIIGYTGTDMYTWTLNGGTPIELEASSTFDVMSYCLPAWISDYNYEALLAARMIAGPPLAVVADAGQECDCLLVWGSIDRDGISLEPAFVVRTRVQLPEATGPHVVEGIRDDGSIAFSHAFEPSEIDHAPGVRHFAFAIPLGEADLATLASLRVRGPAGAAMMTRGLASGLSAASLRVAASTARLQAGTQGRAILTWSHDTFRAALVRDAASGAVLSITNDGVVALGADPAGVDVILSDGVRSQAVRVRRQ